MAGRKPIKGARPVTIRLNNESYIAIKTFASYSPSGLTAADFIRALVQTFGDYCEARLAAGKVASLDDMAFISSLVLKASSREDEEPTTGESLQWSPRISPDEDRAF